MDISFNGTAPLFPGFFLSFHSHFDQEVPHFSLGNQAIFRQVDVLVQLVEIVLSVLDAHACSSESLVHKSLNFSLVNRSVSIFVEGVPNIFNPVFDVLWVGSNSECDLVGWILFVDVIDSRECYAQMGGQVNLVPALLFDIIVNSVKNEQNN